MKDLFIENEYVELKVQNGIIFERFKPGISKISLMMVKVISSDLGKVLDHFKVPMPMFVDINEAYYMDHKASIAFAEGHNMKRLRAVAVLIKNPVALIGAKLFLVISKPKIKMEFFNEKQKAVEWLHDFVLPNELTT